jgi:hypothetical protein
LLVQELHDDRLIGICDTNRKKRGAVEGLRPFFQFSRNLHPFVIVLTPKEQKKGPSSLRVPQQPRMLRALQM